MGFCRLGTQTVPESVEIYIVYQKQLYTSEFGTGAKETKLDSSVKGMLCEVTLETIAVGWKSIKLITLFHNRRVPFYPTSNVGCNDCSPSFESKDRCNAMQCNGMVRYIDKNGKENAMGFSHAFPFHVTDSIV